MPPFTTTLTFTVCSKRESLSLHCYKTPSFITYLDKIFVFFETRIAYCCVKVWIFALSTRNCGFDNTQRAVSVSSHIFLTTLDPYTDCARIKTFPVSYKFHVRLQIAVSCSISGPIDTKLQTCHNLNMLFLTMWVSCCLSHIRKIQLVVYCQCCVSIGWATTKFLVAIFESLYLRVQKTKK